MKFFLSALRYVARSIGTQHGITPCFMAKPRQGLPGNAGHVHISLIDKNGNNVFVRDTPDPNAEWEDIAYLSDIGRQFFAGILEGLPDIMPLLAPTVNSYKRLVENFYAPVSVSWGLEHRIASVRLITPPTSSPQATRLEVRVPGADTNSHYVFAALLAIGLRGIEKKLQIPCPPLDKSKLTGVVTEETRLASNLKEATERFMLPGSIAREVLGDDFVEHFGGTREHEIRLWNEAVTDWWVHLSFNIEPRHCLLTEL
jgi:glutamine synthetase